MSSPYWNFILDNVSCECYLIFLFLDLILTNCIFHPSSILRRIKIKIIMMETETGIEIGGERETEIWAGTGDKDKGRGMMVVKTKIEEEEEITILTTIDFCQINCSIYLPV